MASDEDTQSLVTLAQNDHKLSLNTPELRLNLKIVLESPSDYISKIRCNLTFYVPTAQAPSRSRPAVPDITPPKEDDPIRAKHLQ